MPNPICLLTNEPTKRGANQAFDFEVILTPMGAIGHSIPDFDAALHVKRLCPETL